MSGTLRISDRLLARNAVLNIIGFGLPLLIAVGAIRLITQELGREEFGFLGIAWMLLGFFGELGFGRATTKFVAEALGSGDEARVAGVAWTTIAVQFGFGIVAGVSMAALAPLLAESVLRVPAELVGEVRVGLLLLAAMVPLVVVGSSVRGVLEAAQRFGLINAVRIPATASNYLLPLLALRLGWGVAGILALLLASRGAVMVAYFLLARRAVPALRGRPRLERAEVRTLFGFGGWLTVSSLVSPLLVYLERFLLGALVTLSAVAYYTAPYELLTRLWIVPASLVSTLFPAFSTLSGRGEWERLLAISSRAVRVILLVLGPAVVLALIFAEPVLARWLGPDFAREGALAFRILAVGMLINSLAWVPQALVQGVGRADLTAWFHLIELPVQLILAWILVSAWGVPGAALAWTLRVALDAALLFWAAQRLTRVPELVEGVVG
jgi:O-antigen/teichoic acid export membrane protein